MSLCSSGIFARMGLMEEYYREARKLGVPLFQVPFRSSTPGGKDGKTGSWCVLKIMFLQREIQAPADIVALSTGMRAEENDELSTILKVARNEYGYFHGSAREASPGGYGPVTRSSYAVRPTVLNSSPNPSARPWPRHPGPSTFLAQDEIALSVVTATVDQDKCAACLVCGEIVPLWRTQNQREWGQRN